MHGKKREEYKARMRDPKMAAALSQKAEQWHLLMQELGVRRMEQQKMEMIKRDEPIVDDNETTTTKKTLGLIEKALLVNPDPLYLWNHRRELLQTNLQLASSNGNDNNNNNNNNNHDTIDSILQAELDLTQASLKRNPKAYGAWFHRKWIIQQVRPSTSILESELALTAQFLQLDERNFHCWNYRRFVVAALQFDTWDGSWNEPPMGPQIGKTVQAYDKTTVVNKNTNKKNWLLGEWQFTQDKIKANFSNFSAFHYRSQLLPFRLSLDSDNTEELVEQELALVEDAICTEPDDQTAWWYHATLFWMHEENASTSTSSLSFSIDSNRLQEHAELLRELLAESGGSNNKWILLGLHRVLTVLGKDDSTKDAVVDEQKSLLEQLMGVDSDRRQRYQELLEEL